MSLPDVILDNSDLGNQGPGRFILGDSDRPRHAFGCKPGINILSPSTVQAGHGDLFLLILGTRISKDSTVEFDGHALTGTWFSNNGMVVTIPAAYLTTPGLLRVRLHNHCGYSNYLPFTVTSGPSNPTLPLDKATVPITARDITLGPTRFVLVVDTAMIPIVARDIGLETGHSLVMDKATIPINARDINLDVSQHVVTLTKATIPIVARNIGTVSGMRTIALSKASVPVTARNISLTPTRYVIQLAKAAIPIVARDIGIDSQLPPPAFITAPLALPGAVPSFDAPIGPYTIPDGAPMWSEGNFRQAGPGDAIVVWGANFVPGTSFICCGGDNVLRTATILDIDYVNQCVKLLLPSSLPSNSTILVWPSNSIGYGEPLVIGRPEARFLAAASTGFNQGSPGDICYLHGINLGLTGKCYIILQNQDGAPVAYVDTDGIDVSVGPYEVAFTIPNLAPFNYKVYAHNGTGGKYGWSLCPQQLQIRSPLTFYSATWPSDIDAGAPSGGDDLGTIQALIASVGNDGPATIKLRNAQYKFSDTLQLVGGFGIRLRLLGGGAGLSSIVPLSPGTFGDKALVTGIGGDGLSQVEALTLDLTGVVYSFNGAGPGPAFMPRMVNVNCIATGTRGPAWTFSGGGNSWHAYATGCNLTGPQSFGTAALSFFGQGNNLYLTDGYTQAAGFYIWNTPNIRAVGNTCQDLNPSGPAGTKGFGKFIDMSFDGHNYYVAGNTVTSLYSPPGSGEIMILEGTPGYFEADAVSSSGSTVTFASVPALGSAHLFVIRGTGMGQWGRVTSSTDTTVTLDRALRVPLDTTSQCVVTQAHSDWVYYNNTVSGNGDQTTASTGWETFGAHVNGVVAGNHVSNCVAGLVNDSFSDAGILQPSLNTLMVGNTVTNCGIGFRSFSYSGMGMILRNHNASGSSTYDWWLENTFFGAVLDKCTLADAPIGVHAAFPGATHLGLYNTHFNLGTGTFAGSKANDAPGFTFDLYGTSAFTGFQA